MKRVTKKLLVMVTFLLLCVPVLANAELRGAITAYVDVLTNKLSMQLRSSENLGNGIARITYASQYNAACVFTTTYDGIITTSVLAVKDPKRLNSDGAGVWVAATCNVMQYDDTGRVNLYKTKALMEMLWPYIRDVKESPEVYFSGISWKVKPINGYGVILAVRK